MTFAGGLAEALSDLLATVTVEISQTVEAQNDPEVAKENSESFMKVITTPIIQFGRNTWCEIT